MHSFNHQKLLPYQILGGKIVKNVQIDPQTWDYGKKANLLIRKSKEKVGAMLYFV